MARAPECPARPANAARSRGGELAAIARHAAVVLAGQLAAVAFGLADTLIAGRYSQDALAALSVSVAVYVTVQVGLMGLLQALLPVWAELRGAGRLRQLGQSVRQSLYLLAAASALGMAVLLMPGPLLDAAQVPEALQAEARRYLAVQAWALPPALFFRLYSTLNQSLGQPRLVTALQIGAVLPKAALSAWFTFGGLGVPAQGAAGCAWATLAVYAGLMLAALALLRGRPLYAPYAIWQKPERPDWRQLAAFLRLGVPAALAVVVEVTSFTFMALLVARLGALAAASHQIAASVATVVFMAPLALGIAASARISHWLGAGQPARARHAAAVGMAATAVLAACTASLIALAAGPIARLYVGDAAIAAAAAALLPAVAAYHLGDALQAASLFALRSYRITTLPFVIYAVLLWGLGLPVGHALAFTGLGPWPAWRSPLAFWCAIALAQGLTGLTLAATLWRAALKKTLKTKPQASRISLFL